MSQRSGLGLFDKPNKPARVVITYAGFALLWVLASAVFVAFRLNNPALQAYFDISQNLLFIALTSSLLYWLLKKNWNRVQRLNQLYVVLSQCNQAIVHSQSSEELFPKICRDAVYAGAIKMAWISMVDDVGVVTPVASYGTGECYLNDIQITTDENDQWGRGPVGTAIRENRPIWCESFLKEPMLTAWHERGRHYNWGGVATLPLHRGGAVVGAFNLYYNKKESFDLAAQRLMLTLAQDISFALDNYASNLARINAEIALRSSEAFNHSILNSLEEHIAVLDKNGTIIQVNRAWQDFAEEYNLPFEFGQAVGLNYFDICESSCCEVACNQPHNQEAEEAHAGVQAVLSGEVPYFELEYSSHTPDEERWFSLQASPLQWEYSGGAVVMHKNITKRKLAEIGLRESEARYGTLFSNNNVVMLLVDPSSGQIIDANLQASAFYGWDLLTLRSMNIAEINALPIEELKEKWRQVYEQGEGYFHFRHQLANGELRDVDVFTGSVTIDGRLLVLSSIIDITERKKTEQSARAAQALIRSFLDHLPGPAYVKNSERRLIIANQGFQTCLGIAPDKIVGKSNVEIFPGEFGEKIDADDRRILESGKSAIIEEAYQNRQFESFKFVIEDETHGRLLGGLTLDITQRHLLSMRQQMLLEINEMSTHLSEAEFLHRGLSLAEKITGSAVSLLHFVNEEQDTMDLVACSNNALEVSTATPLSPHNKASVWSDSFHQGRSVVYNDYEKKCAAKGFDTAPFPIGRLASVPVIEDGQVRMMIGVGNKAFDYEDSDILSLRLIAYELWRITRRRRVEEELKQQLVELQKLNQQLEASQLQLLQSEKMASIGQLAAGVAHEINNPISFVRSNFTSLKEYVDHLLTVDAAYSKVEARLNAEYAQSFESVRQIKTEADHDFIIGDLPKLISESIDGLERVRSIVKDLKDFSRAGEAEWQWADIQPEIESALKMVSNEIKYRATVKREYGNLPMAYCIPAQLNQVFMNLIVNAMQAIDERGCITIRTGSDDHAIWVEVQDDGCGIAEENMQRIFDPFYTSKPRGQGTGLGLSLSWGIVQRHKGKIDVDSKLGAGSTFRVTLPINSCDEPEESAIS